MILSWVNAAHPDSCRGERAVPDLFALFKKDATLPLKLQPKSSIKRHNFKVDWPYYFFGANFADSWQTVSGGQLLFDLPETEKIRRSTIS